MANTKVIESLLKSIVINLKKYFNRIKIKIIECYDVITEMGGQIPLIKNIDNLPAAIESIPGKGDYDMISGIRLSDDPSNPSAPTRPLPDGLSLAQLMFSGLVDKVTEIVDSNTGWVGRKSLDILTENLSALKRIQCNAVEWASGVNILQSGVIEDVSLPYLEKINQNGFNLLNIENIELPSVKSILIRVYNNKDGGGNVFTGASKIKHISLPVCESLIVGNFRRSFCRNNSLQETLYMPNCGLVRAERDGMSINNNPMLHTVVFGILKEFNTSSTQQVLGECPNLVHLEIQGAEASINFRYWSPTTALSERLPEFLSNFKTYIAERLTDKGSGLTLTLSQEVRNAIQQDPEIVSIITGKGWTISPAPTA